MSTREPRVAVVIATRNRSSELLRTLGYLRSLPERPRILVVDNASSDGTPDAVRRGYPEVEIITLEENVGPAGGRTTGVKSLDTPYVAFSDDDSWWTPGALKKAADVLDAHPRLAVLAAHILVGPENRGDPMCAEMAASPLPADPGLPGVPVLGFVGCAAIVRRSAFLEVGGFDPRWIISGEEEQLTVELAAARWKLAYVKEVVAHHHPSKVRDRAGRRRLGVRNALWFAWMRRPARVAAYQTALVLRASFRDRVTRAGMFDALRGLPWALRRRRVVPPHVERDLLTLDRERGLRALRG